MKSFLMPCLAAIIFFACSKDKMTGARHVQIRVVNNTDMLLSDAVLGSEIYGSIAPGQASVYHDFEGLMYVPKLSFYKNKSLVELMIGYCGTPPLPEPSYLEDGKYTYTVVPDNSSYYGCWYTFIKE